MAEAIRRRAVRTATFAFMECLVAGAWAMIDQAFVANNALWFVIVGGLGLVVVWFFEQICEFIAWKRGKSHEFDESELARHLSSDRAQALRELAKLGRNASIQSLEETYEQTRPLAECLAAIGLDEAGHRYSGGVFHHNASLLIAQHTEPDTPENARWKNEAIAYHWSMRSAHITALDKWLRGQESKESFESAVERLKQMPAPRHGGEQFKVIAREPRLVLKRTGRDAENGEG